MVGCCQPIPPWGDEHPWLLPAIIGAIWGCWKHSNFLSVAKMTTINCCGFRNKPHIQTGWIQHSQHHMALFCSLKYFFEAFLHVPPVMNDPWLTPLCLKFHRWILLESHTFLIFSRQIPSGKQPHSYGKIHHFFMGKSTISMVIYNSFLYVYQRVCFSSDFPIISIKYQ